MSPKTVLIVDDHLANLGLLFQALEMAGLKVLVNSSGESAIHSALQTQPDLILLDVMMPGMTGFETCRRLKDHPATREIPIIFMTALSETVDELTGLQLGAVDYIAKPFQVETLLARVHTQLALREAQQALKANNDRLQQEIAERQAYEDAIARTNQQLQARVEELSTLNRLAQTLTSVMDIQAILDLVVETLSRLFNVHEAVITLLDDQRTALRVVAHFSVQPHPTNPAPPESLVGLSIPLETVPGMADIMYQTTSRIVLQAQTNPQSAALHELLRARHVHCLLSVPLQFRTDVIGAISLGIAEADREFSHEEVQLAETVAGYVAGAIANARLFQQESQQRQMAESLREVAQILNSSLDREIVLDKLFVQLGRVIPFDSSGVFLRQGEDLRLTHASPKAKIFIGQRVALTSRNPVAQVFSSQHPLIIPDVRDDADWVVWPGGEMIRSWMGVPLLSGDRAIGVLTLDNFQTHAYQPADAHIFHMFANHAAVAIQNAQLFEDARSARQTAEQASRAKSEFLANMSHEIRTPMNAILGFAELLNGLITDFRQHRYLESIMSAGKSLLTLINDILDLSKVEAGKLDMHPGPVHVPALIREIVQIFQAKLHQQALECIIEIARDVPEVLVLDDIRMRQILFNLVGNAIKFTERGHIRLTVDIQHPNDTPPDEAVTLIIGVEDTGIGIPHEQHAKIFEAFTQRDHQDAQKYGGTGLGLTITKRLVEMMGGTITLTSQVGRGTWFTIQIPNVPVQPLAQPIPSEETQTYTFEKGTVLVADDVASNRQLLKEYLEYAEFDTIEAEDGRQAIHAAQTFWPDIILLDLRMPGMDGYETLDRLKAIPGLRNTPVLAVTAAPLPAARSDAGANFDGVVSKPVNRAALLREIARFLPHVRRSNAPTLANDLPPLPDRLNLASPAAPPTSAQPCPPELLEALAGDCLAQWESARKSGSFEVIEAFGRRLCTLGEQSAVHQLHTFGQTLLTQAQDFDVERLAATLALYPTVIAELRAVCHAEHERLSQSPDLRHEIPIITD